MIEAPVGHQCPSCVARGKAATRQGTLRHGGRPSANPQLTTVVLIVLNLAVWAAAAVGGYAGTIFNLFALAPHGTCLLDGRYGGATAAVCAAAGGQWLPGLADGGWWEPLTSMFTHMELTHLGFNMVALWFLGPPLEQALGRARFLAIYFISGWAGAALFVWLSAPYVQAVGASGSIFGMLGALLVLAVRQRADPRRLLFWLGLNIVITVLNLDTISWEGHLGGLIGGSAIAYLLTAIRGRDRERRQWLAIGAVAAVVVGLLGAFAVLN
ncbi:MAG: rhomboid family intramembrane serine protease [Propioniciclava sp.]